MLVVSAVYTDAVGALKGSGPRVDVRSAVELMGGTLTSSVHDGLCVSSTT